MRLARAALLALPLVAPGCVSDGAASGRGPDPVPTVMADPDGGAAAAGSEGGAAPARSCDARAFGAVGDGRTKDTGALQAAIDACAGGAVILDRGVFLSGSLVLRSRVTLRITQTATLRGSQSAADYPERTPPFSNSQLANCRRALLYAEGASDVRIDGGGTIDGNARGVPDWSGNQIKEGLRPMAVFTAGATRVTMEDLTVRDAATWAVVHMEVQGLTLRRLKIETDLGPTHDGIDVVDGHDVLIEDCDVQSGDDSICLKSGSARGTERVMVRRCRTRQSGVANGVKLGTASVGSFRDITVEDVAIENAQAAALAVESVDGAHIAGLTFRRISACNVGTPFFLLLGSRDRDPARVGTIDGVTFEGVTARDLRYPWGSIISGSIVGDRTFGVSNITFRDLVLVFKGAGVPPPRAPYTDDNFPEYQGPVPGQPGKRYNQYPDAKFITGVDGREDTGYLAPGWAFFLRHARGVRFERCRASVSGADPRPARDTKDTADVSGACAP